MRSGVPVGSPAWPEQIPSVARHVHEHGDTTVWLVALFGHQLDAVVEHAHASSVEVVDA